MRIKDVLGDDYDYTDAVRKVDDSIRKFRKDEPTPDCGRMSLSVYMITNFEKAWEAARAVSSIYEISDEIVICDTRVHREGIPVFDDPDGKISFTNYPWQQDFSEARNHAFSRCTKDWVLWIDDDDVVPEESAKLIRAALDNPGEQTAKKSCVFNFRLVNIHEGDEPGVELMQCRMLPNDDIIRWSGKIHENCINSTGHFCSVSVENIFIHHYGYMDQAATMERMRKRNLPMLLDSDMNYMNLYHLAATYFSLREFKKSRRAFIKLIKEFGSALQEDFQDHCKYMVAMTFYHETERQDAIECLKRVKKPDASFYLGEIFFSSKQYSAAIECYEKYLGFGDYSDPYGSEAQKLRYYAHSRLVESCLGMAKHYQVEGRKEFKEEPQWRKNLKSQQASPSQGDLKSAGRQETGAKLPQQKKSESQSEHGEIGRLEKRLQFGPSKGS